MRNHRYSSLEKDANLKKHGRAYEFKTSSNHGGKPLYRKITTTGASSLPNTLRYMVAKEYNSACADGVTADGLLHSEIAYKLSLDKKFQDKLEELSPEHIAVNGAIDSAQDFGEILLLVSLAESKQTYRMLVDCYINLRKFLVKFMFERKVRGEWKDESAEALADYWLELRYGWRPFILECQSLYSFATKLRNDRHLHSTYGKKGLRFDDEKPTLEGVTPLLDSDVEVDVRFNKIFRKSGFLFYNKDGSGNNSRLRELGLSIESLLSTAYELIPYSFVFDFFVNLGDFLNAYNFKEELEPFNGYSTIVADCSVIVKSNAEGYHTVPTSVAKFKYKYVNPDYVTKNRHRFYAEVLEHRNSDFNSRWPTGWGKVNYSVFDNPVKNTVVTLAHHPSRPCEYRMKDGSLKTLDGLFSKQHPSVLLDRSVSDPTDPLLKGQNVPYRGYGRIFTLKRTYKYVYNGKVYKETRTVREDPGFPRAMASYNPEPAINGLFEMIGNYSFRVPPNQRLIHYKVDPSELSRMHDNLWSAGLWRPERYVDSVSNREVTLLPAFRGYEGGAFPQPPWGFPHERLFAFWLPNLGAKTFLYKPPAIYLSAFDTTICQRRTLDKIDYRLHLEDGLDWFQIADLVALSKPIVKKFARFLKDK